MKRYILIALSIFSLLSVNAITPTTVKAQVVEQEVMGVKLSKAYPNPAIDVVQFDYSVPQNVEKAELQFFNLIGKVVLRKELRGGKGHTNVIVNKLEKGVYFYRLVINDKDRGGIQKLIIK